MSFAVSAALFQEGDDVYGGGGGGGGGNRRTGGDSAIMKKRRFNRTQRNIQLNQDKVNNVIETIQNRYRSSNAAGNSNGEDRLGLGAAKGLSDSSSGDDIDDEGSSEEGLKMGDFLPPPQSIGAHRTIAKDQINEIIGGPVAVTKEGLDNMARGRSTATAAAVPQPFDGNEGEQHYQDINSAFMNEPQLKEYYSKHRARLPSVFRTNRDGGVEMGSGSGGSSNFMIDKLNYIINLLEEQQDERTDNVTEEVILYSFLGIFMIFLVDSFSRVGKYVR